MAGADQFGEYVVNFEYFLIDVNRYQKNDLILLANMIGSIFLLDQSIDWVEYSSRFSGIKTVLQEFDPKQFQLFAAWFKSIFSRALPEPAQAEMIRILDESNHVS